MYPDLDYKCFQNELFAISHIPLTFMFIYFRYKSRVLMSHCIESQGISIFISLNKHHVKIIKLNGSDPSKIYILCHVQFFE